MRKFVFCLLLAVVLTSCAVDSTEKLPVNTNEEDAIDARLSGTMNGIEKLEEGPEIAW
jgi:hypothetical protein